MRHFSSAAFRPLVWVFAAAVAVGATAAGHQNSLGMKFVPVPRTAVQFSIWTTRVQDFAAFVKATGYNADAGMLSLQGDQFVQEGATWRSPGFEQGPTHPVTGISWVDAHAFCAWLTQQERAAGRISSSQEYRLPTDEEWSVAVGLPPETGATPAAKSRKVPGVYPWGTAWPPETGVGNYGPKLKVDDFAFTSPVGSFRPNAFGLFDMGGNVWQWCEDRLDPAAGTKVVRRGSSFRNSDPGSTMSSVRDSNEPDYRRSNIGFRCVLAETAPKQ